MVTRLSAWIRTSLAVHTAPGRKSWTQTLPTWARATAGAASSTTSASNGGTHATLAQTAPRPRQADLEQSVPTIDQRVSMD
jgi:hypothetical protein